MMCVATVAAIAAVAVAICVGVAVAVAAVVRFLDAAAAVSLLLKPV